MPPVRLRPRAHERFPIVAVTRALADAAQAARAAGLLYVSDTTPGISRRRAGKGFAYRATDGRPIRDRLKLARIRSLAIPPAWTSVWICPNPNGHLQATGRDARRRKQYRYHPEWRAVRDGAKFDRMLAFARALPQIRARAMQDQARRGLPREKVLATLVRLLEITLIRVGNREYARAHRRGGRAGSQQQCRGGAADAGGEVIVSRGELVEIGGSFRIPDIIGQSGARLVEVGTTNKTRLADYARALTPETRVLLKVHPSNYRIVGFTAAVSTGELAALGRERGRPVVEDLGSGSLIDLRRFGLPYEPTVVMALGAGADLVTFSGDKLLGGPQAGLIVGRRALIARLELHPLLRALRPDKLTLAALQATLSLYRYPERLRQTLPVLELLAQDESVLQARAERLREMLAAVDELGRRLQAHRPAVVARIGNDCLVMDMRTLRDHEVAEVGRALREVLT